MDTCSSPTGFPDIPSSYGDIKSVSKFGNCTLTTAAVADVLVECVLLFIDSSFLTLLVFSLYVVAWTYFCAAFNLVRIFFAASCLAFFLEAPQP